MPSWVF